MDSCQVTVDIIDQISSYVFDIFNPDILKIALSQVCKYLYRRYQFRENYFKHVLMIDIKYIYPQKSISVYDYDQLVSQGNMQSIAYFWEDRFKSLNLFRLTHNLNVTKFLITKHDFKVLNNYKFLKHMIKNYDVRLIEWMHKRGFDFSILNDGCCLRVLDPKSIAFGIDASECEILEISCKLKSWIKKRSKNIDLVCSAKLLQDFHLMDRNHFYHHYEDSGRPVTHILLIHDPEGVEETKRIYQDCLKGEILSDEEYFRIKRWIYKW